MLKCDIHYGKTILIKINYYSPPICINDDTLSK